MPKERYDHQDKPRPTRRKARALAIAVALGGSALLFAACGNGSGSGTGVASVGSTTTTTAAGSAPAGNSGSSSAGALKYAQCMRTHGFPTFPDPNADGGFTDLPSDANPTSPSPKYTAANKTCQSLNGGGGHQLSAARQAQIEASGLKFAQCMRSHGVSNYPDPTYNFSNGGVTQKSGGSGLNQNSPQFQAAQKACQSARIGR